MRTVEEIEERFLEVSGISCDLTKFPLDESNIQNNIKISKEKSNQYGEVFTPLWLIDKMILKATVEKLHSSKSTLDLCAGWGQFTIRMIRALANYNKGFNIDEWLKNNHTFIELQLESAYKLLYIFGVDINLFVGDALEIQKVIKWNEINYFDHCWKSIPKEWIKTEIVNGEKVFVERFLNKFKEKHTELLTL